jgi:Secretion system C-terminal sorting domain
MLRKRNLHQRASLWGNANGPYTEASMAYTSDLNWASNYKTRGWIAPKLLSYMESHDEERMMYKNINYGNSSGSYNVKNLATALKRTEMAAVVFFCIPGPKMIWQFGELGYDVGINTNGRTGEKPINWNYIQQQNRLGVYNVFSTMMNLRNQYPVFHSNNNNFELSGTVKKAWLQENGSYIHMIANTDVKTLGSTMYFQDTGKWYEVFSGDSIRISNTALPVNLQAGEYRLYSNLKMQASRFKLPSAGAANSDNINRISIFPNPANNQLFVSFTGQKVEVACRDLSGKLISKSLFSGGYGIIATDSWAQGMYILNLNIDGESQVQKIIINR